jgi:alpha-tubulin suppressor-like RCC1 family protein
VSLLFLLSTACGSSTGQIVAGAEHTCRLVPSGRVDCWGGNASDQLAPPDQVFSQISSGPFHICGLTVDSRIECWGAVDRAGLSSSEGPWSYVATGAYHTCALDKVGHIHCWGPDEKYEWLDFGQAQPPDLSTYKALSLGAAHTCGQRENGTAWCWGNTDWNAFQADQVTAQRPREPVSQVASGWFQRCSVLSTTSELVCNGGWTNPWPATEDPVHSIVLAEANGCALSESGLLDCWGPDVSTPPKGEFAQVAVGVWHACAVDDNFDIECWGNNRWGQLDVP